MSRDVPGLNLRARPRDDGLPLPPADVQGSLMRLLPYARRVWPLLAGLFAAIAAGALLELAVPWVMGFMLLDGVIRDRNLTALPLVALLLTGIFVGQKVCGFAQEYLHELANQRVIHALRCDFYDHLQRMPLTFFERRRTGELLSRVTSDVDTVDGLLRTLVQDVATEIAVLAGTLAFLYTVNARLTLFILPTVAALALSVFFFKRTAKQYARRVRALIGELAALAAETIGGIRIVKAYCGERYEAGRFAQRSDELLRARVTSAKLQSGYSSIVDLCVFAGTLTVVVVATPWVVAGTFTVGGLVAYLVYLGKLNGPAKKLSKVNLSIQKILASADRIFEVMSQPAEDHIERHPPALPVRSNPVPEHIPARGGAAAVRFDHVTFAYEPDRPVITAFDMDVEAGAYVALVGRSGAGKTTVASLLLRFYDPTGGRILIDGVPLTSVPLPELRRQIGLVQQDVFLFSGTIRDNIAYARPDARTADVLAAARVANAHEFIERLPQGYDSPIGERGVTLSGGQRQRLAIARALLTNPRVLVFDEATSHLDSESERLVRHGLAAAARGRTVITIAHRLSTIAGADRIIVLDAGEIVETGTHDQLLARDGVYRRLLALQTCERAADAPAALAGGSH
jgi:subfamily B ATP-binding cassette protein MsbA